MGAALVIFLKNYRSLKLFLARVTHTRFCSTSAFMFLFTYAVVHLEVRSLDQGPQF